MFKSSARADRTSVTVIASIATVMVLLILAGGARFLSLGQVNSESGSDQAAVSRLPVEQSRPASVLSQQAAPCDLSGTKEVSANSSVEQWSLADFVANSPIIARVHVIDSTSLRFDTPDGSPPPPVPTAADDYDEELPIYDAELFRTLTVAVDEIFKGADSAQGYAITRPGGVHPQCPDYTFRAVPLVMTGEVGDVGLLFVEDVSADLLADPSVRLQERLDVALQASQPPAIQYRAMSLINWYRYVNGSAVSAWLGATPIEALEAEVEALIGN